ncbi:hypothetical protein [Streptomyces sp. NBC_01462]|uniref:hypothetical protein n=1 Tax=Streptomyces sp. NBC_01462 TaxID=2903876 RepID=UPI002E33FDE5|nr:hypothetical protein [Streptomyces sp. NBC_01462]
MALVPPVTKEQIAPTDFPLTGRDVGVTAIDSEVLSRTRHGLPPREPVALTMSAGVWNALTRLRPAMDLGLHFDLDPGEPPVRGGRRRLSTDQRA